MSSDYQPQFITNNYWCHFLMKIHMYISLKIMTLWKVSDVGFVKNKFNSVKFVYDSGIRINLVTDYFEIYLPIYSNLGWEIGQPNYDQKIRFKFTVDPKSLFGLFRRRWYWKC